MLSKNIDSMMGFLKKIATPSGEPSDKELQDVADTLNSNGVDEKAFSEMVSKLDNLQKDGFTDVKSLRPCQIFLLIPTTVL